MAIGPIVTRGYGDFGTVNLVVTRGYASGSPVPPATVDYQSDGKGRHRKKRERSLTDELFDSVERSLVEILRGAPEVGPATVATIGTGASADGAKAAISAALERLSVLADGDSGASERLVSLRQRVADFEKRRAIDDDDEEIILLSEL